MTWASERSRDGVWPQSGSPHPPHAVRKGVQAFLTSKQKGSGYRSDTFGAKEQLRSSETSIMARQVGVQCKACGQSISTGIADPSLPIPSGPVHCPYCRQEHFYLERDRIEFDTENGLPLIDPP
jgi:hypothetical protein